MRIGILSDTHNDSATLTGILNVLRESSIKTLIHCGDLTSPTLIPHFEGFQVFLSYGNCDYLTGEIYDQLIFLGTDSKAAMVLSLTFQSITIGVIHGHDHHQLELMQQSGRYQYLFTGHTHKIFNQPIHRCHVVNPGAAQARGYHRPTYAILDLDNGSVEMKRL